MKPPTHVSFMYLVYRTVIHSLQSNPLYQISGDSGRSSCGAEVVGAALVPDSFRFLLYFPVRLYFPLVPDNTDQRMAVIKEGKKSHPSSALPVSRVGPVNLRNPCRRMNTIEATGHATPSSVESGGLRDLFGGK